jgi:broad specificity phosphatase PhoE
MAAYPALPPFWHDDDFDAWEWELEPDVDVSERQADAIDKLMSGRMPRTALS